MIKKCLAAFLFVCFFGSCHKSELTAPAAEATTTFTSFKDENIALVALKMEQTSPRQVTLRLTTRYEINIKRLEVYSGTTTKNLCSFRELKTTGDSHELKTYEVVHDGAAADVNFYMIKYSTRDGNFAYSPVYQIKMKP